MSRRPAPFDGERDLASRRRLPFQGRTTKRCAHSPEPADDCLPVALNYGVLGIAYQFF